MGRAHRDFRPPRLYLEASSREGASPRLGLRGELLGYVAGRPFPLEGIRCGDDDSDAAYQLAWNAALAWEGDGAKGKFLAYHDLWGTPIGERVRGNFHKLWLAHRVEPELRAQGARLFPDREARFVYHLETWAWFLDGWPSVVVHYDHVQPDPRAEAGSQGPRATGDPLSPGLPPDTLTYLAAFRRWQRHTGWYRSKPLPETHLMLEALPDLPLQVAAHAFRCAGRREVLAPFAAAPRREKGERGRIRFERRRVFVLDATPWLQGADYARRRLILDAQTMRVLYRIDFDPAGRATQLAGTTYLWSGDDPSHPKSWTLWEDAASPPAPERREPVPVRSLIPFETRVIDLESGLGRRFAFHAVRTMPFSTRGRALNLAKGTWALFCIAAGTPIATPEGPRPVESLRPGDAVLSYDLEREAVVATRIGKVRSASVRETLLFPGGLRVTGEHPLRASGRWVEARHVKPEARLLRRDGSQVAAGEALRIDETIQVYDLTVEGGPPNFFAADRLVHNKGR